MKLDRLNQGVLLVVKPALPGALLLYVQGCSGQQTFLVGSSSVPKRELKQKQK